MQISGQRVFVYYSLDFLVHFLIEAIKEGTQMIAGLADRARGRGEPGGNRTPIWHRLDISSLCQGARSGLFSWFMKSFLGSGGSHLRFQM